MDNGASSYRRFREYNDENGLVEIIKEYKDGLIFFLAGIVGDITKAEELAEDTFVLIGVKKPRDSKKGSFKTWLYTIGRNLAIDYLRRKNRCKEVIFDDDFEISSEEHDLEMSFIRQERNIVIHQTIRILKSEYQQVLWLIYFEEMSIKEAAMVMKKTVHSVETLVYRARRSLKVNLEKKGVTYEDL